MRERPSTVNRSVRLSHKQNRKVAAADFRDASRSLSEPPTGTAIVRKRQQRSNKESFCMQMGEICPRWHVHERHLQQRRVRVRNRTH